MEQMALALALVALRGGITEINGALPDAPVVPDGRVGWWLSRKRREPWPPVARRRRGEVRAGINS